MGSESIAIKPVRVMTMDVTAAKIGRSMKKWEIMPQPYSCFDSPGLLGPLPDSCAVFFRRGGLAGDVSRRVVARRLVEGRHFRLRDFHFAMRVDLQKRAHDDPVLFFQPRRDDAQAVFLKRPGRNAPRLGLVLGVDHVEVLMTLVRLDGPINDEQRLVRLADGQPNPHEHARRQEADAAGVAWGCRRRRAPRDCPFRG